VGIESRLKKAELRAPQPSGQLTICRVIVEPSRVSGGPPVPTGRRLYRRGVKMPLSVLEAMKRGGILTEETPEEIARANSAGVAEAKGSGSA
jgi:hypothetical protein